MILFRPKQILFHRAQKPLRGEPGDPLTWQEALTRGMGLEIDLRDRDGAIILEHDLPRHGAPATTLEEVLQMAATLENPPPLALNIKADGLAPKITALLDEYLITNYFCFDMSIPDSLQYHQRSLCCYDRVSEHEPALSSLALANRSGVWLDAFSSTWYDRALLRKLAEHHSAIALVSAELHSRHMEETLDFLDSLPAELIDQMMVCTDRPGRFLAPSPPSKP